MSVRDRSPARAWLILLFVLVVLGILLASLIARLRVSGLTIERQRLSQELALVAKIVTTQLQQGQYQGIDELFASIATTDSGIAGIDLTAANGFAIASYRRPGAHATVISLEGPIAYSYGRGATLRLVEDLAALHQREKSMEVQLGGLYVAGSLLLALALHLALQRDAEASRLRRALEELRARNRTLRVLSDCNQALVHATSRAQLLESMCEILVEQGGFALAWIGMAEESGARRVRPVAAKGEAAYLEGVEITWADSGVGGTGPTGQAIRSGSPSICRDILKEPSGHPWSARAARFGFRSSIALPLGKATPAYGTLNLYVREALHFDEGEVRLLVELASDIDYGLQSLRAEERRHEAEQRSQMFLRKASDGLHILDYEGRLVDASDSFCAALGWSRKELLGRDPSFWDPLFARHQVTDAIERLGRGEAVRFEIQYRRRDGSTFPVEVTVSGFELAGASYFHCSARDLTEVRKLQREVIGAATREQRRLAYELHDALGQELTAARLLADTFAARAAPESAAGLREVSAILSRSLLTARGIVSGLSPLVADGGNLSAGLARLAAASSTENVQVQLSDTTSGAVAISLEDRGQLFRIAQEAIQNALKHANARRIDIQLTLEGPELKLTVADDGSGIMEALGSRGGHGAYSLRYRASAVGGRLHVGPRPGGGTIVSCSVPNQGSDEPHAEQAQDASA